MREVKKLRRSGTKISAKHQVTIPLDAMRAAGLSAGERVIAHAEGPGRVVLEREHDLLGEFAGVLTEVYESDELESLRREWD